MPHGYGVPPPLHEPAALSPPAGNRNRIKHTNKIVNQYMHWFDDEVFEQCPTWEMCIQAGKIPRLDLERYFGKADENGPGNYAQSVKYGVGRRVLAEPVALIQPVT